jgi:hypothetical protein
VIPGLQELLSLVPDTIPAFGDTRWNKTSHLSEFPFPVSQAFFGEPPDAARLRYGAEELEATWAEPQEAAWIALAAAEAVESSRNDVGWRSGSDIEFNVLIFNAIKQRAGWALLVGSNQGPYATALEAAGYTTLVTRSGLNNGMFIGARRTSAVCFAQILARYALLYGNIKPGQLYDFNHFVQEQGPLAVIMTGKMQPIESLLCLSLMHLGVPGAAVRGFPWETYPHAEIKTPDQAIALLSSRATNDPRDVIGLPKIEETGIPELDRQVDLNWVIGGTERSFLFVDRGICSEGIAVIDEPTSDIGIVVTIDDDTLKPWERAKLEDDAVECLNILPGLHVRSRHPLTLAVADASPSGEEIAEAVRHGLRRSHTHLGPLNVAVIGDSIRLANLAEKAAILRAQRAQEIGGSYLT